MAQKKEIVTVELTDASDIAAYNAWVAAKEARDKAEDAMEKAAAMLKPTMRAAKANTATIAGKPVLRLVDSNRVTFDAKILRKYAPAAAARAEKVSVFDYLRKA